jgi:lipoprotein-anchoring transpeptidase ErfK/SrfK
MTANDRPSRAFLLCRNFHCLPLLVVMLLAGCASIPELGALADRGDTSGRRIVVNLKAQKATMYHKGKLVAESRVSSGREGKGTPVGKYRVIEKDANHRSSLYGNYVRDGKIVKENVDIRKAARPAGSKFVGVPMPYFLRFTGAYGLHAGNLPGYPASSGCVRLPKRQAKRFYDAVRVGTPVTVVR